MDKFSAFLSTLAVATGEMLLELCLAIVTTFIIVLIVLCWQNPVLRLALIIIGCLVIFIFAANGLGGDGAVIMVTNH